jgi:hypothetical protein
MPDQSAAVEGGQGDGANRACAVPGEVLRPTAVAVDGRITSGKESSR